MDPLKELAPEVFETILRQNEVVMAEGALPTRVKELIAVALSISTRCESGATPEEVAETIAVATLIEGGPAYVWSKQTMAELYAQRID